jgi:hypothetical protein
MVSAEEATCLFGFGFYVAAIIALAIYAVWGDFAGPDQTKGGDDEKGN